MSSNIGNLSELENVLCNNEKTHEGVLQIMSAFKIGRFLSLFEYAKSKGWHVSVLLFSFLIFRLRGESVNSGQSSSSFLPKIDDNAFYRLMNNSRMDWRRLLLGIAKQFKRHVNEKGDQASDSPTCFVLDDTDLPKTGKTFELFGRIFNHVTKQYPLGFKLLLLSIWDGKSLVSLDFSLHREKGKKGNCGLTKKEQRGRFRKIRDKKSHGAKRVREMDAKKTDNAIAMIKRAVKNGFSASYVLMDSWFVNDTVIKGIRAINDGAMHIIGMCRIDRRKYLLDGKEQNISLLITRFDRKKSKYSRKYKSRYIPLVVDYKGVRVKLFCIKYNNAKNWTLLLTTDLTLSFVQTIETYQIRWTTEVLFKECKQYLRLGKSQNTDFDGQIADTTLALVTHTVLTLQKRFGDYETMGILFRQTQQHLLGLTLWERLLKIFAKMVLIIMEIFNVDMEDVMDKLLKDERVSRKLLTMLSALDGCINNHENNDDLVVVAV